MAKAIMIQGTMSNAGKSLITAGLCRIFKQDGYRVAPFKSQNMALNSYVTEEGLEMGRAQVMQAEAAGIKPSVLMNPILLKPTGDMGSQVIVNGEVRGNMSAADYFQYKRALIPDIMNAYRTLAAEYDIIVIEGAGSPAEINLKADDIVNMGMAKMAGAPVLLIGDIDRGGVFAQLYGTVLLLDEEERYLVKGLIVNKFRGDKTILDPGIRSLQDLCKKEIVGVVPWMDVDLDDEDSLSERLDGRRSRGESGIPAGKPDDPADTGSAFQSVDIAVIRLPRISNYTDFHILESMRGVSVRYVKRTSQLGRPDLILLPGTKNTMRDLLWLRRSGLEDAVLRAKERGAVIFGICGGYQMLGRLISDPAGVEEGGSIRGLGLLPMDTVFAGEKTRTRVEGSFGSVGGVLESLSGAKVTGYEIHMGQSFFEKSAEGVSLNRGSYSDREEILPLTFVTDRITGERKSDGAYLDNVYGTYIHGVFDQEETAEEIIRALAARREIRERTENTETGTDNARVPAGQRGNSDDCPAHRKDMKEAGSDADGSRQKPGRDADGSRQKPGSDADGGKDVREDTLYESGAAGYAAYRERQYEKLAEILRQHLDMDRIYEILEAGA